MANSRFQVWGKRKMFFETDDRGEAIAKYDELHDKHWKRFFAVWDEARKVFICETRTFFLKG